MVAFRMALVLGEGVGAVGRRFWATNSALLEWVGNLCCAISSIEATCKLVALPITDTIGRLCIAMVSAAVFPVAVIDRVEFIVVDFGLATSTVPSTGAEASTAAHVANALATILTGI